MTADPLTPPDCDLRGFAWMPLDVRRLLDSDLWILSTGDELKAAIALWAKAWQQVPAASLPDDDRLLRHLSGAGEAWPRVKEMALRGFQRCSDGRLYHAVLAEKALEAWAERQRQRDRQRKWRERAASRAGDGDVTVTSPPDDASRDRDVTHDRDRDRDRDRNRDSPDRPVEGVQGDERAARADRGSRLPAGWRPSDEDRAFAAGLGVAVDREAASFVDYWRAQPGQKGRKSDWSATWRNWVRKSAERRQGNGSGHRTGNGFLAVAREFAAADRDRDAGLAALDPGERPC